MIGAMDTRFSHGLPWDMWWEKRSPAHLKKQQNRDFPVILFCCSGGARMQEGIVSLMQMAKKHRIYIIALIDDASRFITGIDVFYNITSSI